MQKSSTRLIAALWRSYRRNRTGAAAAEFAILLPLLTIPILNAIDVAVYAYDRMELNQAAQAAAQSAWGTCAVSGKVPALQKDANGNPNCANLATNANEAASSTAAFGAKFPAVAGGFTEGYYCTDANGNLVAQANGPVTCASGDLSGDYVFITVTYNYQPLFRGVTVTGLLTTPLSQTASMRLE